MRKSKVISFKKYTFFSVGVILIFISWFSFFAMILQTKMYLKNWYIVSFCFILFLSFSAMLSHHNLYYLIITPKEIIIKNLCFFWFQKTYQIDDIKSVSRILKRTAEGGWYGIVINSKSNLKDHTYYMDSIKPNFWEKIEMELNKVGIKFKIRN